MDDDIQHKTLSIFQMDYRVQNTEGLLPEGIQKAYKIQFVQITLLYFAQATSSMAIVL